jgi:ligand-binding sensor protein
MTLTDLLTLQRWQALEDEMHAHSGLQSCVFDADGIRISGTKRWANRLCPAIKADDRGQSYICAVAHMNLAAEAARTGNPVVGECDAGMVKFVVPIFHADRFLGVAGGCGLLLDDGEVDAFMLEKTLGMEAAGIAELSHGIPRVTSAQLDRLAAFVGAWLRQNLA